MEETMGIKFRKKIRILPGFYLNLSKSGMSATIGIKGLSTNIGKTGAYLNTGIPGSGIYNRTKIGDFPKNDDVNNACDGSNNGFPNKSESSDIGQLNDESDLIEIRSYNPELITSDGLFGLKESIINAQEIKTELFEERDDAIENLRIAKSTLLFSHIFLFGFIFKSFKRDFDEKMKLVEEAQKVYSEFNMKIDVNFDKEIENDYITLKKTFLNASNMERIWDVRTSQTANQKVDRTKADYFVTLTPVRFSHDNLEIVKCDYEALRMGNANGGHLFIYPGFILMKDTFSDEFGLIDFRDIEIIHKSVHFHERSIVPKDSKVVDHTWTYVNKNGKPDNRYKYNPKVPIALYYDFEIRTKSGLHERYLFSNVEKAEFFCKALEKYIDVLKKMNWEASNENS